MLELVEVMHQAGFVRIPADADVARIENLAQLVPDQVDDGLEVELRCHPLLDAVDDGKLRCSLLLRLEETLRLVEEAGIFERDAHAACNCREQANLGLAKGVLALVVLELDGAQRAVAADDGNDHHRLAHIRPGDDIRGTARVPQLHLTGVEGPVRGTTGAQAAGRNLQALAVLVDVEPLRPALLLVPPADGHVAGVEHFAQLVADQVDDGLEVELRRDALLDAVDHRQLGGALLLRLE